MLVVMLHSERLSIPIEVLESRWHKVSSRLVSYAAEVAERERELPCWVLDGTPEVDDLEALGEEVGDVSFREVQTHTAGGRFGSLSMISVSRYMRIFLYGTTYLVNVGNLNRRPVLWCLGSSSRSGLPQSCAPKLVQILSK